METIKPGKYFEIAYRLYRINDDGSETLVHEVTPDDPDRVICGMTMGFVEALDEHLLGLKAGEKFDFTATPDKAFGPYTEDEIYNIPRDRMTVDGEFKEEMFTPGALIPLMTPDGYRIDGTVVRLTDTDVVLDLNHPLAKNSVHYEGEVITVREPSADELQPAHGCGGCHGSCGDGGCEGGCGDHDGSCGCEGKHGEGDCGCGDSCDCKE